MVGAGRARARRPLELRSSSFPEVTEKGFAQCPAFGVLDSALRPRVQAEPLVWSRRCVHFGLATSETVEFRSMIPLG